MNQDTNQAKYGQLKALNLTIDQSNLGQKKTIHKCVEHKMKGNMLLLKDLLEP